jgi:lysophospholipase L1-like esterase
MIKRTMGKMAIYRMFVVCAWLIIVAFASQTLHAKPQNQSHGRASGTPSANVIQNSQTLSGFYGKLLNLGHGEPQVVSILHIGDSHIQAGFLTSTIRNGLQQIFGNAGRGLVFPYTVARTNGPLDTKSQSNVRWTAQFSPSMVRIRPTGIMGISITSEHPDAEIDMWLLPREVDDGVITRATIFHDRQEDAFRLLLVDSDDHSIAPSEGEESPYSSSFNISPSRNIRLVMTKTDKSEHYTTLYGISLENGRKGILYHDAGVNGGSYTSVNGSDYFGPHLSILNSDLVIVSLGTNDVNQKTFDPDALRIEIDRTLTTMKQVLPRSAILITTPGDFGRSKNKLVRDRLREARKILIQLCRDHRIAYWDFNGVMGGPYSIDSWYRRGLVQSDMVHLNKAGYHAEGELFLSALLNGYKEYQQRVE